MQTSEVKEKIRQRWNESADTFDQCPGHGVASDREKMAWKAILKEAIGDKPLKILDVGTGTGFLAILLTEMGHSVTGIDIAEEMIQQAREKAGMLQLPIAFQKGDADSLYFENETFDAVINRHVFWTMPEPEKTAAEWARVIKPGGKLVIIDGDWNHYNPWKKIWKVTGNLLVWITEGRNPWKRNHGLCEFEKDLPMAKRKRPEADIEILKCLGLKSQAKSFKDPRAYGMLDNWKYGYYQRFIITAVK